MGNKFAISQKVLKYASFHGEFMEILAALYCT